MPKIYTGCFYISSLEDSCEVYVAVVHADATRVDGDAPLSRVRRKSACVSVYLLE